MMKPSKTFFIHSLIYLVPQMILFISKMMDWGIGKSLTLVIGVLFLAILIAITISEGKRKNSFINYFYTLGVVVFSFLLFGLLTAVFSLFYGGFNMLAGYIPNIVSEIILNLVWSVFPILVSIIIIFFQRRKKNKTNSDVLDSDLLG